MRRTRNGVALDSSKEGPLGSVGNTSRMPTRKRSSGEGALLALRLYRYELIAQGGDRVVW